MHSSRSNIHFLYASTRLGNGSGITSLNHGLLLADQDPISLALDACHVDRVRERCDDAIDILIKELTLWHGIVGCRQVECLELVNPFTSLEPYEITSFVHSVASQFKVTRPEQREHRVVFSPREVCAQNLMLMRGLGFNQCQLLIDSRCEADCKTITKIMKFIRDHRFSVVGIQLTQWECMDEVAAIIASVAKDCQPDYIFAGNSSHALRLCRATIDESSVISEGDVEASNIICLGPESSSTISSHRIENLCSTERYMDALAQGILPFSVVKSL